MFKWPEKNLSSNTKCFRSKNYKIIKVSPYNVVLGTSPATARKVGKYSFLGESSKRTNYNFKKSIGYSQELSY